MKDNLPTKIDYLIIGAGIAGLGVAYELQKHGKEVLVMEKESISGGRMSTITVDGIHLDLGAKFLTPFYKNIGKLQKEFSIKTQPQHIGSLAIQRDGKLHIYNANSFSSIWKYKGLSMKTKIRLGIAVISQLVKYRNLDMYDLQKSLYLDDKSTYEHFLPLCGQECFDYLLDPMCTSLVEYDSKQFSRALFFSSLAKLVSMKFYSFEGGINQLALNLANTVKVQNNIEVQSIKRNIDSVTVHAKDFKNKKEITFQAKKVICAIPGSNVLQILQNPTPAEKRFFSQVKYSSSTIVFFKGKTNLFKDYSTIWYPAKENPYFVAVSSDFYNQSKNNTFIGGISLRKEFAEKLTKNNQFNKNYLTKFLSEQLGIQNIQILHLTHWQSMCPIFYAGYSRKMYQFLDETKNERQIFYCGDYLQNPSTEGALTSGLQLADKLNDA